MVPFKAAAIVLSLASTLATAADLKYEKGAYQIDPAHSKVGFEVSHLVISTVEGRFTKFDGSIDLASDFAKSKVKLSADIASVDTGQPKRDDHLKSPDFFDAKKFPTMSFESSKIEGKPEGFKLTGTLKIKDKSKLVTFDAKYLGTVKDGYGNEKAAFSAKAVIKRAEFGLTWNNLVEAGPVVGDEVTLDLRIQAARPVKTVVGAK